MIIYSTLHSLLATLVLLVGEGERGPLWLASHSAADSVWLCLASIIKDLFFDGGFGRLFTITCITTYYIPIHWDSAGYIVDLV